MSDFTMPSLGADMDEGTLLEWLVKPGDSVHKGDILAVVDTSKAAVEVECFADGVVQDLVVEPGTLVPVGTVLATMAPLGAEPAAPAAAPPAPAPAPAPAPPPAAAAAPHVPHAPHAPHVSSPLVRREAEKLGVDLTTVSGTGRGGAITRADVDRAAAHPAAAGRPRLAVRPQAGPRARRRPRPRAGPVDAAGPGRRRPGGGHRAGHRAGRAGRAAHHPDAHPGGPRREAPGVRPGRAPGGDAAHDRDPDGPVQAGDPALLPHRHHRPRPGAGLDARAQPGPARHRAPGARGPAAEGDRARRGREPGAQRLLGRRRVPARPPGSTSGSRSRCAAAGSSPRRCTTPTSGASRS